MKLIAIDLDGTLLTEESKPSSEGIASIRRVLEQGKHRVSICTGRAYHDVRHLLGDELKLPVISSNGAAIYDENGRLLHETPIRKEVSNEAIIFLKNHDIYFEIYCPETIYTEFSIKDKLRAEMDILKSANPEIDGDQLLESTLLKAVQFGVEQIEDSKQIIERGTSVLKLIIFTFNSTKLDRIQEHFDRLPSVHTTSSAEHTLEIISKETDKGLGVRFLANHFGIPMEDTVVIGDSYNDLSMFRVAGGRIAMGNAVDEIKQLSTAVTRDNNDHGVAYALNHLIGD